MGHISSLAGGAVESVEVDGDIAYVTVRTPIGEVLVLKTHPSELRRARFGASSIATGDRDPDVEPDYGRDEPDVRTEHDWSL